MKRSFQICVEKKTKFFLDQISDLLGECILNNTVYLLFGYLNDVYLIITFFYFGGRGTTHFILMYKVSGTTMKHLNDFIFAKFH